MVSQYKSASYEYGSFYVTTSYPEAITYSGNVGGELGQWAYSQCVGFSDLQIALDEETASAARVVVKEYEKYQNSEKVVLVYSGVHFEDLYTERGGSFLLLDQDGNPNVEYNAHQLKRLYETDVTDDTSSQLDFRLANPDAYTAMMIRQKDFKEGFSVFTNIWDIDQYLRWDPSEHLRQLL